MSRYFCSCSFGKDSIATALLALRTGEPLDELVYCEVMFDDVISGEVPEHRDFIYDMARKGVTQEALALELGIDRRMVYKILHSDSPSMEQCVAICVALKLPYFVSEKIIENAGLRFRRTDKHHLYRQMLVQSHHLTVERCNDILTRKKMLPFFPNSETNIGVS